MPEGHTLARIARDQTKMLAGQVVRVSSPQGRFPDAALIDGQVLQTVESYGKHLFYWWANGLVGHVHLGLFGKFRVNVGPEMPDVIGQVRMRMSTDRGTIDLAGPTDCSVGSADVRDAIIARLGPDPLRRGAKPDAFVSRIQKSAQPIGALLLDQKVLAGVGNVYRAEALFVNGIHPSRPGRSCSTDELMALWLTISAMLKQGVKDNRIITIDRKEHRITNRRAQRGDNTYVYHRDICLRCGTAVQIVTLGGRACYFCPTCQPH